MRTYYADNSEARKVTIRKYSKQPVGKTIRNRVKKQYRASPKGKATIRAYLSRHTFEERSRGLLRQAVRSGRIRRGACGVCGEMRAHGHHEDYTQPLAVLWLCHTHHTLVHQYKSGARTLDSLPLRVANFIRCFKVKKTRRKSSLVRL